MTRAQLHTVSLTTLFMLAACPPGPATTDSGSATESGSSSSSSSEGGVESETVNSTPATPGTVTESDTGPTGTMGESESNSGTTTDTTGPSPTSTGPDPVCSDSKPCEDPATPFCVADECVSCDQTDAPATACAGLSEDTPVCAGGVCVECSADDHALCQGNTPVCGADNSCTACTVHSDCPDTACNLQSGACFGPEYVIYVDRTATCDVGDGSMAMPFCKIAMAFQKMIDSGDVASGWTVKIKSGNYVEEPLVVPDAALVVLSGWDGVPKIRAQGDTDVTLTIANDATVYIDHLAFNSNDSDNGIECTNATVWIDESRIAANTNQGYQSTDCDTTIRRSVIYDNDGGGLASYGPGHTYLINSYVSGNGTQNFGDYAGIRSAQGNEMHIIYTTVANNLSETGPRSLHCTADAGVAEIRNSVLIAFGGMASIDCPMGVFRHSALDEEVLDGMDNIAVTVMDIMNFFNPPAMNGIYTAKADTPLATLGQWMDGDPLIDYDGTPRVTDAPDYAGADKP